jgi:hypothetical protein
MTIRELAERLNIKAVDEGFSISALPELRKKHLNKKRLPKEIFNWQTIKDGVEKYAFHIGGRDEIQFNFGEENINNKLSTRFGLCFSLDPSPSLHHPVEVLDPFRNRFNECFEKYPELFDGFEMWYYQSNRRFGNYTAQKIPETWFQINTFICLGNLIKKPLSSLNEIDLKVILSGFDKLLPIYEICVLQNEPVLPEVRIFTRLTSNENNWELPSHHKWNKENQGKNNIPFENQYGFGHEEWLFNPRYNVNGFQYGFIRGLQHSNQSLNKYGEVHLYTVKKEKANNFVYCLGFIKNVLTIKKNKKEQDLISAVIDNFNSDMITEVEYINGDVKGIIKFPFEAVVKFKLEDVSFFDEPIYQPNFELEKFKRFQPYKLTTSIDAVFENLDEVGNAGFVSGKSSQTSVYNRKNKESSVTITKLHSEIVDSLEVFLKPKYSLKSRNISIETMRFNGNIADVVTEENDLSISIYEIKTSSSGRRNLRDAIAQLLDYALHSGVLTINKLIIVSPSSLAKAELSFKEGLKTKIKFPIEYLCYQKDSSVKFIKQ